MTVLLYALAGAFLAHLAGRLWESEGPAVLAPLLACAAVMVVVAALVAG